LNMHLTFCAAAHDPSATELHPLSLHDALPIYHHPFVAGEIWCGDKAIIRCQLYEQSISGLERGRHGNTVRPEHQEHLFPDQEAQDRKSTRLNSSHVKISYAVFCLKKQKIIQNA